MRLFFYLISGTALLAAGSAIAEPRIDGARDKLPEKARQTLDRIPEQGRKLLALRSYLRSAKSLEARWSWSQAEIDAYMKSDQYVSAMAAVAAVVKAFEVKNPGYTLHVNTDVRSLEEQIGKWNRNGSVQRAGGEIDAATTKWLAENPKAGPDELRAFLVDWKPGTTAMLAAPGLTDHGRGEAIDFQVAKDGAVIAGADSGSSKWDGEGWKGKLQEAVRLSMMPFEGPLTDPNEPWHYEYEPPERSKLVVVAEAEPVKPVEVEPAERAKAKPAEQAGTAAREPIVTQETPAASEVIAAVPVPIPAPRPAEAEKPAAATEAEASKAETAKAEQAKAEPAKPRAKRAERATPKKATKKQASRKPAKRAKARKGKKRWGFPFNAL